MSSRERRRSMNFAIIGAVHAIIGATCFGGRTLAVGGNVLVLVALKLGASEMFLGLLSSAMLSTWVFRIFTMSAVEKYGKRKIIIFWKMLSTLCIVPLFFLPAIVERFSAELCLLILLTVTFVRGATYALGNTGWFPLLHDIVPRQLTGRFFATMRTSWQTAGLVTLFVAAWFLGRDPDWWKFQILFIVAFVAYMIRALTVLNMVENPPGTSVPKKVSIFTRFREVLAQEQLRRLVLYISTYMIAATIVEPFKIKFLKDLGYGYGFILGATAMISLGAIVSLRFWGKLADRFGNHWIFTVSHIGIPVSTVLWIFIGKDTLSTVLVLALFFFWSVFNSGNRIAQTRYILHAVPADRQNQINVINVIASFVMGIAPLLGGLFLGLTRDYSFEFAVFRFNNYHILFIISAALFVLPHLLCGKIRQKADAPTMQVVAIVAHPLLNIFGPFMRISKRETSRKK